MARVEGLIHNRGDPSAQPIESRLRRFGRLPCVTDRIPQEPLRAGGRWRCASILAALLFVVVAAIAGRVSGGGPMVAGRSPTDAAPGSSESTPAALASAAAGSTSSGPMGAQWPWPVLAASPCASQTNADLSPVETAYAYFRAWNAGDAALMRSYVASGYQDCENIGFDNPLPGFKTVTCKVAFDSTTHPVEPPNQVVVACSHTFGKEAAELDNPTGLWMRREPPGHGPSSSKEHRSAPDWRPCPIVPAKLLT